MRNHRLLASMSRRAVTSMARRTVPRGARGYPGKNAGGGYVWPMQIGSRPITGSTPPYVIAEIGVNHDGSPQRALQLTELALRGGDGGAGAEAVKFQLFEADRLMSRDAKLAAYQKAAGERDPLEMLRRLELSIESLAPCVQRAHELGKHAIVSVFSVEMVEIAEQLPWDAYKAASPDIVNRPLLEALAATGKPMIVSTGASTLDEVTRAMGWLQLARDRLALLQCVSSYPAPEMALGGIKAIGHATGLPVGYSDHTRDFSGSFAVAFGACMLEKHITYDRKAAGPDHRASLLLAQFGTYVSNAAHQVPERQHIDAAYAMTTSAKPSIASARRIAESIGSADTARSWAIEHDVQRNRVQKIVLDCERDVRTVSRQSVVSSGPITEGATITRQHLTIKRPGTGILAYRLEEVVGRTAARDIEGDVPIVEEDLR